ncbi:MAG: sulfatase-like hydrolase/transferase [Chthoniobacterales bacterium]
MPRVSIPTLRPAALLAALGLLAGVVMGHAQAQTRPNFVFIALDDLDPLTVKHLHDRTSLLSVLVPARAARYALSSQITPNMNRLADRGVTFTYAWASYPLCNASRSALLTGVAAARSGYYVENKYPIRDPRSRLRDAVTLPEILRKSGYLTFGLGKIFHFSTATYTPNGVKDWPDIAHSWSGYLEMMAGTQGDIIPAPGAGLGRLGFGIERGTNDDQPDWINAGLAATLLTTGAVTTIDFRGNTSSLALDPSRPFFLGVGFRRPHSPWAAPQEWLDRVPPEILTHARIDLNEERKDLKDTPRFSLAGGKKVQRFLGYHGTARSARSARRRLIEAARHYLGAVAFADACVGRVLDALDASPYANNTVVVLWSDHGYSWGQKLHVGKSSLWESSLRAELIIADLRTPGGGREEDRPVSLLDIYPTVCDLAGLGSDEPRDGDGASLMGAVHGGHAPARTIFASYRKRERAIRFGPWKYITYGDGPGLDELYNLRSDPFERHNILNTTLNPPVLPRIKAELHRITSRYILPTPTPTATPVPTPRPTRPAPQPG